MERNEKCTRIIKKKIRKDLPIIFENEETAIAAGYRPCAICMPQEYKIWKKKREDLKNDKVKANEAAVQKLESDYRLDIKEINIEGAADINASNACEFAGWIGDSEIMRIISNKESLK